MEGLTLKKGGLLEHRRWNGDKGCEDVSEVSDIAFRFLSDYVTLDDDVTLKDLFLLINKNLELFDTIFGNWTREYVTLALTKKPHKEKKEKNPIDYLELAYEPTIEKSWDSDDIEFNIGSFPNFQGITESAVKKDRWHSQGERIKWGISFTPVQDNAQYLLRLSPKITIYNEIIKESVTYKFDGYSLYEVFKGVLWELSWYGDPTKTNEIFKGLKEQVKKIKSGEEETFPAEDVFRRLDEKIKEETQSKIPWIDEFPNS